MFSAQQLDKASDLLSSCRQNKCMIASAESCTGGLVAALFTEIAGSSDVFERGFVTYSNEAKAELLGVPMGLIDQWGAVSLQVAEAMANGAIKHSRADLSISVTGIAGPGGGSTEKPVGLVYLATANKSGVIISQALHLGDIGRGDVRKSTVLAALELLQNSLEEITS